MDVRYIKIQCECNGYHTTYVEYKLLLGQSQENVGMATEPVKILAEK